MNSDSQAARRGRWVWITAYVAGVALGAIGGCSSTAPAAGAETPADFSVAVVVRVPEAQADAWTAADRSQPRAVRPARYLLEADDLLRVVIGPGGLPRTFPPPTRRLTRAQVDGLWARVRDSGLLTEVEEASREALGQEFADRPAPVAEPTAIMVIRVDGRRLYRRQVMAPGSAAYELTDALAELAWIDP